MNHNFTKQIVNDINEEFAALRRDVQRHLGDEVSIDHARELLAQHVPALVVGRAKILLDSLLNYLMEDAVGSLADAPTEVKNDFYSQDLRARLKGSFTLEPQTLQFSFDPRIVAGSAAAGGTIIVGGLIVGLVLGGVVTRIIAGLATLVASAFAFRIAHSAGTNSARRVLDSDVNSYLTQSKEQVSEWLSGVESSFVEAFDKFAAEYGMRQGDQS